MSAETDTAPEARDQPAWLTPGFRGIGVASLLSDLGHEVPTSLLPSLLTSTLHAPASALGQTITALQSSRHRPTSLPAREGASPSPMGLRARGGVCNGWRERLQHRHAMLGDEQFGQAIVSLRDAARPVVPPGGSRDCG